MSPSRSPSPPSRKATAAIALVAALLAAPGGVPHPPRSFTIVASGDVLVHRRIAEIAGNNSGDANRPDFAPMLARVEPWITPADLAICHLEGTLTTADTGHLFYPRFVVPDEIAPAIASAGFDTCSTAGNHSLDAGEDGVVATLDALDAAGVRHDGTARTPQERDPGLYRVGSAAVTVAHISYTFGLNGRPVPEDKPWAVNLIDADAILADAVAARKAGAEFVIVSLHWGRERVVNPTPAQRELAEALLGSDSVDLILGTHAHVVQPVERINGKYVVYGMGNFLSNQNSAHGEEYYGTEDGVIVHIRITEQGDGSFAATGLRITPTWVHLHDYVVYPTDDAIARDDSAARAAASRDRTVERVGRLDAGIAALTPTPWPEISCLGMLATIVGTAGSDVLVGTPGNDVIVGRSGDDTILAGEGDDIVCGGGGADNLASGPGRGILLGGDGDDVLGGPHSALLIGGAGTDACHGGFFLLGCERGGGRHP